MIGESSIGLIYLTSCACTQSTQTTAGQDQTQGAKRVKIEIAERIELFENQRNNSATQEQEEAFIGQHQLNYIETPRKQHKIEDPYTRHKNQGGSFLFFTSTFSLYLSTSLPLSQPWLTYVAEVLHGDCTGA
jgi:hypothetical protein